MRYRPEQNPRDLPIPQKSAPIIFGAKASGQLTTTAIIPVLKTSLRCSDLRFDMTSPNWRTLQGMRRRSLPNMRHKECSNMKCYYWVIRRRWKFAATQLAVQYTSLFRGAVHTSPDVTGPAGQVLHSISPGYRVAFPNPPTTLLACSAQSQRDMTAISTPLCTMPQAATTAQTRATGWMSPISGRPSIRTLHALGRFYVHVPTHASIDGNQLGGRGRGGKEFVTAGIPDTSCLLHERGSKAPVDARKGYGRPHTPCRHASRCTLHRASPPWQEHGGEIWRQTLRARAHVQ